MQSVIRSLLEAQKCLREATDQAQAQDFVLSNGGGRPLDSPYGAGLRAGLLRAQDGLDEALGSAYLAGRSLEGWR